MIAASDLLGGTHRTVDLVADLGDDLADRVCGSRLSCNQSRLSCSRTHGATCDLSTMSLSASHSLGIGVESTLGVVLDVRLGAVPGRLVDVWDVTMTSSVCPALSLRRHEGRLIGSPSPFCLLRVLGRIDLIKPNVRRLGRGAQKARHQL